MSTSWNRTLMPHQQAELEFLLQTPRAFLFSETGTGKTASLLGYAATVLEAGKTVLWLTEAGLMDQLLHEASRWLPDGLPQPTILRGNDVPRGGFLVASHQWAAKNHRLLESHEVELTVVDEADVVGVGGSNPTAATFRAIRGLAGEAARSVLVTATPGSTVHGLDLHALLEAGHAPGLCTRQQFEEHVQHVPMEVGCAYLIKVPLGLSRLGLAHLQWTVSHCSMATRLSDVGTFIPDIVRSRVLVPLSKQQQATYDRIRRQAKGLAGDHDSIVVFAENFSLLDAVAAELQAERISLQRITGKESMAARTRAIDRHRDYGGVLLGTRAIETGLNLQHASLLVSVVSTWSQCPVGGARRRQPRVPGARATRTCR